MDKINFKFDPKGWTLWMNHAFVMAATTGLGLRFVFSLLSVDADSLNGFVGWVNQMSAVLLTPFRNVFSGVATSSDYNFEYVTLFALAAYMVLGLVVMKVVSWSTKK